MDNSPGGGYMITVKIIRQGFLERLAGCRSSGFWLERRFVSSQRTLRQKPPHVASLSEPRATRVILYAGSSGSSSPSLGSPGSPSSGYQTQSPSPHSQPSSPEEVVFTEIGVVKQRAASCRTLSSKLVPVSTAPKCPPSGSHSTAYVCTPHCRKEAMRVHRSFHKVFSAAASSRTSTTMCVKNESCLIMRMNRNRCQHCRFKKCLSVGICAFWPHPQKEKQRLLDEMQSYMNSLNESAAMEMESPSVRETASCTEDSNSKEAIGEISRAYRDIFTSSNSEERSTKSSNISSNTCPFSQDASFPQVSSHPASIQSYQSYPVVPNDNTSTFHNVDNNRSSYLVSTNQNQDQSNSTTSQRGSSANHNSFHNAGSSQNQPSCPWKLASGAKVLACPLNAWPVSGAECTSQQIWESFSQCFTPAVKEVVEFAKGIPGFQELGQQDQVMLLKSGTFQVLMVRFCTLFNAEERTVTFLNGQTYPLSTLRALGMGTLLDAMFDFSEKLGSLGLEPDEMALFMAVVLVSADRSGILDMQAVEQLQEGLIRALRSLITRRRPDENTLFPKLLLRLPDLRTLNNMHSDKLLAFRIDP
ncbi:hypothetical protein F7725_000710 [Dissostichus mawsoni]|uniref:NR LBD domain-containing protein n=1 Tax=Dissostichus mawsoni TaxID=36200 RepID=A0A7J5ZF68_DISMA|nr:hypothetical protein F7725_000710 [Dissostichus mawsoni]